MKKVIEILKKGGVICYPTDTIYGIGCSIKFDESVKRIYEIKHRFPTLPLSVAFSDMEQVKEYTKLNEKQIRFIELICDRGTTFLVPKNEKISNLITAGKDSVGIRIPAHELVKKITEEVGPIITTSANISGNSFPKSFEEISKKIKKNVDYVLEGECYFKKPSTIYDLTKEPYSTIRN